MARRAKYICLSIAVFSLAAVPACRDRLFDNPFDPDSGEVVFEVIQTLAAPVDSPRGSNTIKL